MTPSRIIVCDDEELIRWSLAEHLRGLGYQVEEAGDGQDCLDKVRAAAPDLVVTDLKMPRLGGLELLRRLRESGSEVPVIVITAHGDLEAGIEATRLGARAFVSKPFDMRELSMAAEKVLSMHRLETEVRYLRGQQTAPHGRIIGESPAMKKLFAVLDRLTTVDAPTVLLTGESGTGKDVIAHAIHERGPRRAGPFMAVDCAGIPETLVESELFGHERGSFTDAKAQKQGLFEVARGGTIFLDEIGEMTLATQAKLLRALENRTFKRVGGVADIKVDSCVIAATNRDLQREVEAKRFREDLYFRLNVIRVNVPALRERKGDVPLLIHAFLERFNVEFGRNIQGVSAEALEALERYAWPGNVRELRNVLERISILEADELVRAEHLPPEIRYGKKQSVGAGAGPFVLPDEGIHLEALERSLLLQAMERTNGNQSRAAKLLGISRYALRYRLEKLAKDKADGPHAAEE